MRMVNKYKCVKCFGVYYEDSKGKTPRTFEVVCERCDGVSDEAKKNEPGSEPKGVPARSAGSR